MIHPIVTLTLSPCIDKSASVPLLIPEKKLRCTSLKLEPGGGGINVARAIKKLGGEAIAIFPVGGYTGKFLVHLMENESIPSIVIETMNETRENIIITEASSNNQYRFGMPGAELVETEWKACLEKLQEIKQPGFIVVSGSLPPGVSPSVFKYLSNIASVNGSKFVADTSGEALKWAMEEGVYLVKPNLGELSRLAGVEKIESGDVEKIARQMITHYKCEIMVVSMGKAGAILVTKDQAHTAKAPDVARRSTVGAGDSMVAGIVYSLSRGFSLLQSLQYGVACGTAATMNPGTELCRKTDADHLFSIISDGSGKR